MDTLRLIEFVVAILIIGLLVFLVVRQSFELNRVKSYLKNESLEKFIYYGELQKLKESVSARDEDFIDFLSNSRDDAFQYIENVQGKIESLIVAWNYHNTAMPPDGSSEKKLFDAYSELVEMLPKDTRND
jgi:hypothetical protein